MIITAAWPAVFSTRCHMMEAKIQWLAVSYYILYYIIFLLYLSTIITNHFTRQLEPIN